MLFKFFTKFVTWFITCVMQGLGILKLPTITQSMKEACNFIAQLIINVMGLIAYFLGPYYLPVLELLAGLIALRVFLSVLGFIKKWILV